MTSPSDQQLTLTDDQTPGQSSSQQGQVTNNNATVNLPSQQKLTLTDDQTPGQSSSQQGQVTSNNVTVNLPSLQPTRPDDQTPDQSSSQQVPIRSGGTEGRSIEQKGGAQEQIRYRLSQQGGIPTSSRSQQPELARPGTEERYTASTEEIPHSSTSPQQPTDPIRHTSTGVPRYTAPPEEIPHSSTSPQQPAGESDDLNQHVRKYVDLLKTKKFDEAKTTRQELSKLKEGQLGVTAEDFAAEATERKNGGEYLEAILIFNIAADFYAKKQNPEVATAKSLVNCAKEIKETIELLMENSDLFSRNREIVRNHVIPIMFDITEQIRNLQINEEVRCQQEVWCLHWIVMSQGHIGDLASSKKTIKRGIELMETKLGNESSKYRVYGHLFNNRGVVCGDTSRINEAIEYFTKAIEVYKTAEDLSDENRGELIENSEKNLRWCKAKLLSLLQNN